MNDLISRSKVISVLEQLEEHSLTGKMDISNAIYLLNNTPTAYDIDKVVEELEEMIHPKQLYFCKYARGGCKHLYNNDKDCMECIVENAIEIVKQSGVSDDFCEWNGELSRLVTFTRFTTNCGDNIDLQTNSELLKAFRYCPFCGKKIKVME